jgi:hypothetical protein
MAILVSDWLISKTIFSSEIAWTNEPSFVGTILVRSSIKIAHFAAIRYQTWPRQAIVASDWLISKKYSPLKPLDQMNRNLVGRMPGRTSVKNVYFAALH